MFNWCCYRDKESMHQEDCRGKHQRVAANQMRLCLDGSPEREDKIVRKYWTWAWENPDNVEQINSSAFCLNEENRNSFFFWSSDPNKNDISTLCWKLMIKMPLLQGGEHSFI